MSRRTDEKILPERLNAARKTSGLTQVELAQKLGLHPITVAKWEIGLHSPSELALRGIADSLSTSVAWLRGDDTRPPKRVTEVTVKTEVDYDLLVSVFSMVEKMVALLGGDTGPEGRAVLAKKLYALAVVRGVMDVALLTKDDLLSVL